MTKLTPYLANKNLADIAIELSFKDSSLDINYRVKNSENFKLNSKLSAEHSTWGLWNYDVLEVFLQRKDSSYLEFQTTPLNQFFVLDIKEKRKLYFTPLQHPFIIHDNSYHKHFWQGRISIQEIKNPKDYKINITSILGLSSRNHFALKGNFAKEADFHLPENFLKLSELL